MTFFAKVVLLILLLPPVASALEMNMEVGVRGGVDAHSVHEDFTMGEVYCQYHLPWQTELNQDTRLYARIDTGAGVLDDGSESGVWIAIGGDVVLSMLGGAWEIEVGSRPTWISEHEYDKDDFGGPFQFISHAGTTFLLGRFTLGYRYQHMSNANLYDKNPGIDLHMLSAGMRF